MKLQLRGLCLLLLVMPLVGLAQEIPLDEGVTASVEVAGADKKEAVVTPPDYTRSTVGNRVMDEMDLARTEITGNQELPKVLYIVPWKKADPGDLMGRPANTLLDEVLAPIDRSEFIREIEYYGDLYGRDNE